MHYDLAPTHRPLDISVDESARPPFAILLNSVPIVRVTSDRMLDACAELMIHCGTPEKHCSVRAMRLPGPDMANLPWYTEAADLINADGTPLPPKTEPLEGAEPNPTEPVRKVRGRPARVTVVEPGSPIGAGWSVRPWPEHVRCVPSSLLRSGLFAPTGSAGKRHRKPVKLVTPGSLEVSVQGTRLLHSDLDVFLGVLHAVRREVEGSLVRVSMADLIAACGRTDGSKTRKHLVQSLRRLNSAKVWINDEMHLASFEGSLLRDLSIVRGDMRTVTVRLPADFYVLFSGNKTYLDLADRQKCASRPVAGWLQAFLATHRHPFAYSRSLYRRLTALDCTQFAFNRQLDKALKHLVTTGFLIEYMIDRHGNVRITRKPILKKSKSPKS
jgi:hypothetical protein